MNVGLSKKSQLFLEFDRVLFLNELTLAGKFAAVHSHEMTLIDGSTHAQETELNKTTRKPMLLFLLSAFQLLR